MTAVIQRRIPRGRGRVSFLPCVSVAVASFLLALISPALTKAPDTRSWSAPISRATERIIKKPFGLYVSPAHSPVQPERFTGYHTGVDFETFPEEQRTLVPISAVCNGLVAFTGWARGYGGVVVERCTLEHQPVTVLYGHLKLASRKARRSDILTTGERIGLLGNAYSSETDGERKHLHLAIHKGRALNFRGYVTRKSQLQAWLDVTKYFAN